jgi:hypothetical protein
MMGQTKSFPFPWWLFAILAIGGLMASGVYIGIQSLAGISTAPIIKAAGFGIFGLLMFLGALKTHHPTS